METVVIPAFICLSATAYLVKRFGARDEAKDQGVSGRSDCHFIALSAFITDLHINMLCFGHTPSSNFLEAFQIICDTFSVPFLTHLTHLKRLIDLGF